MSAFAIPTDPQFESIYNLVPKKLPKIVKAPQHVSKHDHNAKIPHSTLSSKGPNIGQMRKDVKTASYLKKKSNPKHILKPLDPNQIKPFNYNNKINNKAPVPNKNEKPIMNLMTEKNFITANAVECILRVPSLPVSNQTADFLAKDDYGKVPGYLAEVKAEIKNENEMIDNFVKSQMDGYTDDAPEMCVQMPEEEREELIHSLKLKWGAVNKKYQVLVMHTMFEGNRKHAKESFEKQLNDIEADLSKLQVVGPVMVAE